MILKRIYNNPSCNNQCRFEVFEVIHEPELHLDLLNGQLDCLIPLEQLDERDLGLQLREVFPDACPWASAEPVVREGVELVALLEPPLRSELSRVLVVLLRVVHSEGLDVQHRAFLDRDFVEVAVFFRCPAEEPIDR